MKIRYGHVSNSSSSSFVIVSPSSNIFDLAFLFSRVNSANSSVERHNQWKITIDDGKIKCSTDMDNFDLLSYCTDVLKIPESLITEEY